MTTNGLGLLTAAAEAASSFSFQFLLPFSKAPYARRKHTTLRHKIVSAIVWFKGSRKLVALYKSREAYGTNNDSLLLGSSSNNARTVIPKIVGFDILHNVLVVVNKSDADKFKNVEVGAIIDKTEAKIRRFFHDTQSALIDNEDKVAARLPICVPIPFGSTIKVGTLDQNTYSSFDDIDDSGFLCFWAENINKHNADLQKLLLEDDDLKQWLPATPATGHAYLATPYVPFSDLDDDDVQLSKEIKLLGDECEEILARAESSQNSNYQSARSQSSGNNAKPGGPKVGDSIDVEEAKEVSDTQMYNARIKAWGATLDKSTGKISFPKLSRFIPQIRDASTKATQQKLTISTIKTIERTVAKSRDFMFRSVDVPRLEKVVAAFIGNAMFSDENISSLEIDSSEGGWIVPMFLPDSASTAKAKSANAGKSEAEEALDEHASKRTKLSTTFSSVSELRTTNALLATFANIVVLALFYCHFDVTSISSAMPSVVDIVYDFADIITTKKARDWFKDNPNKRAQLIYWILSQTICILVCFARAANDVELLTAIMQNDLEDAPTDHYKLAYSLHNDTKTSLEKIFLNSTSIPDNDLWDSSAAKKELDKRDQKKLVAALDLAGLLSPRGGNTNTRKGGPKNDEQPNQHNSPKRQKTVSADGFILCKNGANVSLPTEYFNQTFKLCKANAADGIVCSQGNRCGKDHSTHEELAQTNEAHAKILVKSIDRSPNLEIVKTDASLLQRLRQE